MKKKYFFYAFLAITIIIASYWLFIPGKRITQARSLVLLNRQPVAENDTDFIINDEDLVEVIKDNTKLALFNEMRQVRGMNIIKTKFLAKLITSDNDSIDIVISLPGCFVTDQRNKKTYGFKSSDKQKKLHLLLFGK